MYPRPLRIATIQNLRRVWETSPDSRKLTRAPGIDGVTARRFSDNLLRNLEAIRSKLLRGCYEFSGLRAIALPKANGDSFRIICIPIVADRLVQRLILNHLLNGDKLGIQNGVSYGFIKGRGVSRAAKEALRIRDAHPWAFKSDITSFFDRIDRQILCEPLEYKLRKCSILPLLKKLIYCKVEVDLDTRQKIEKAQIQVGLGLRQGMPLSSILSNFVLKRFDHYFERKGISLVRYADDFIIFGHCKDDCHKYYEQCQSLLQKLGHCIPSLSVSSKTVICDPDEPVEFLGFEIRPSERNRYELCIPRTAFINVKDTLRSYSEFEHIKLHFDRLDHVITRINNVIDGFINAYALAANARQIQDMVFNLKGDVIAQLVSNVVGVNIKSLDKERRSFLGLSHRPLLLP